MYGSIKKEFKRAYYEGRLQEKDLKKCHDILFDGPTLLSDRETCLPYPSSDTQAKMMLDKAKPRQPWWWYIRQRLRKIREGTAQFRQMKMLFKTEAKLQKVMARRDRLETRLKETAGRTCAGQRRLEKSLQESACRQAALEAAMSAAQDITEYETLSRHHANIVSERRIWLRTWIPFISIPTVLFTIIMLHANGVHISHDMIGAVTVFIIVNATLFAWTYLTYPH